MQVTLETTHPLTDESIKSSTGKTWSEWFETLDAKGGPSLGRREIGNYLYAECKVDQWWCPIINFEYEAARGIKEKDGKAKGYTICATKTINSPLDKVYAAWASADSLNKWFANSNDAKVEDGGAYSNSDGDKGTYKRVRKDKDLRITWENPAHTPGSIVDIGFTDKGNGKTGIIVTHDRIQTTPEMDGLRRGWLQALDRLKAWLEG